MSDVFGMAGGDDPTGNRKVTQSVRDIGAGLSGLLSTLRQIRSEMNQITSQAKQMSSVMPSAGGRTGAGAWQAPGAPGPDTLSNGMPAGLGPRTGANAWAVEGLVTPGTGPTPPRVGAAAWQAPGAPGPDTLSNGMQSSLGPPPRGARAGDVEGLGDGSTSALGAAGLGRPTMGRQMSSGAGRFFGSPFGQALTYETVGSILSSQASATQSAVSNDLLYNQLRIGTGQSLNYQRTDQGRNYTNAMAGGFLNGDDRSQALQMLLNRGYTDTSLRADGSSMLRSMAQFSKFTGSSAVQTAAIAGTLDAPRNVNMLRGYGMDERDFTTGKAKPVLHSLEGIYQLFTSRSGHKFTADDIETSFTPGSKGYISLTGMGFSPDQIASISGVFRARAQTGESIDSSAFAKDTKKTGLTQSVVKDLQEKATAAQGVDDSLQKGRLDSVIVMSKASKTMNEAADKMLRASTKIADGVGIISGGIGAGGSLGNAAAQVGQTAILAKLLGGKGAAAEEAAAGGGGLMRLGSLAAKAAVPLTVATAASAATNTAISASGTGKHKSAHVLGAAATGAATGAAIGAIGLPIPVVGEVTTGVGALVGGLVGGGIEAFKEWGGPAADPGGRGPQTVGQIVAMAKGLGKGNYRVTSTIRHGDGHSLHDTGNAVDFAGPKPGKDTGDLLRINQYFAQKYGKGLAELIYAGPGGTNIKNGSVVAGMQVYGAKTMSEHHNHVHVGATEASLHGMKLVDGGDPTSPVSNIMMQGSGGLGPSLAAPGGNAIGGSIIPGASAYAWALKKGMSKADALKYAHLTEDPRDTMKRLRTGGGSADATVSGAAGSTLSTATAPAAPSNVHGNVALAKKMAAARGWTGDEWNALYAVWNQESGFSTTAGSPAHAYGIPQALPGNKMASAGADWLTNPATQIKWGLDYIAGRYHDPLGALAQKHKTDTRLGAPVGVNNDQPGGWYSKGAWRTKNERANLHEGEMVLPASIATAVRSELSTGKKIDGLQSHASTGGTGASVTINVYPAKADAGEARKLAEMVKGYLQDDRVMTKARRG